MLRQHPLLSQRIGLAAGRRQQRVQAQALVVIDVLVAQSRAEDTLAEQFLHGMIHPGRITLVVKAPGQFRGQAKLQINLAQQQRTGIARKRAAGEIGHDFSCAQVLK